MWRSAKQGIWLFQRWCAVPSSPSTPPPAGETQSVRPGVTRLELWLAKTRKPQEKKKNPKPKWASSTGGGLAGEQAGWLERQLKCSQDRQVDGYGDCYWRGWGGTPPVGSYNSSCPSSSPSESCSTSSRSSKSWGAEVGQGWHINTGAHQCANGFSPAPPN